MLNSVHNKSLDHIDSRVLRIIEKSRAEEKRGDCENGVGVGWLQFSVRWTRPSYWNSDTQSKPLMHPVILPFIHSLLYPFIAILHSCTELHFLHSLSLLFTDPVLYLLIHSFIHEPPHPSVSQVVFMSYIKYLMHYLPCTLDLIVLLAWNVTSFIPISWPRLSSIFSWNYPWF